MNVKVDLRALALAALAEERAEQERAALSQWDTPRTVPVGQLAASVCNRPQEPASVSLSGNALGQAVPLGHVTPRNNGTLGTIGTAGTAGTDCDETEITERAAMAVDCVPVVYLDAWARMQCQRLPGVPERWQDRAVDCAGRLLDCRGEALATLGWTPGDLFDIPHFLGPPDGGSAIDLRKAGLCWQLRHGDVVEAIDAARAIIRHPDGKCWTFTRWQSYRAQIRL